MSFSDNLTVDNRRTSKKESLVQQIKQMNQSMGASEPKYFGAIFARCRFQEQTCAKMTTLQINLCASEF